MPPCHTTQCFIHPGTQKYSIAHKQASVIYELANSANEDLNLKSQKWRDPEGKLELNRYIWKHKRNPVMKRQKLFNTQE